MTYDLGLAALVASLEKRDTLSTDEKEMLYGLGWRARDYGRGAEIVPDRSRPSESCLLVSGLASRAVLLRNGSRQLTAVHVQGDFVDLHGMLIKRMDHSVIALTDCRIAFCEHGAIERLTERMPHLTRMLSVLIGIDAAVQRAWMVGLGRRNPVSHLAHLICELYMRLEIVGAVEDWSYDFPVGQAELADMLGLSVVHTNRTLQELRSSNAMSWRNGRVRINDWNALVKLAEFDPTYLSLEREPR